MEERKKIVEKLAFKTGVRDGRRMVNEVKVMRKKLDKTVAVIETGRVKYFRESKERVCNKTEELDHILTEEIVQYAPKRIQSYFKEVDAKIVDNAVAIFSRHLKELTLGLDNAVPTIEWPGLQEVYREALSEASKKRLKGAPKEILSYYDKAALKRESVLETFVEEERAKESAIDKKNMKTECDIRAKGFIDKLEHSFDTLICKNRKKLERLIREDRYNLKKTMTEEELASFFSKYVGTSYFRGIDSEYNKDSIKDIYPFHLNSAPYLKDDALVLTGVAY